MLFESSPSFGKQKHWFPGNSAQHCSPKKIPLPPPLEAYKTLARTSARSTVSASADLKLDLLFEVNTGHESYQLSDTTGVVCLNTLIDCQQETHWSLWHILMR
jgi:hypothetical protein